VALDPALAGLLGALVGGAATFGGPFLATVSRRGTNGKGGLKSESWRRTPMQCGAS
jgi:hypothetical protein